MFNKTSMTTGLATLASMLLLAAGILVDPADAQAEKADYTAMSPSELAEHLVFKEKGFTLDQETQEGKTALDRMTQDENQKACSVVGGGKPDADTLKKVNAMARESIVYPEGGIKLGDWEKGEDVARSGYGFRIGHRPDDHAKRDPGGNCYACHELDPEEIAYGTLGPSLKGFGKTRGSDEATLKYVYEVIYNPHSFFPCTNMPRFGANAFLTQEQILDVMAYVLDPKSPVNGGPPGKKKGEGNGGSD